MMNILIFYNCMTTLYTAWLMYLVHKMILVSGTKISAPAIANLQLAGGFPRQTAGYYTIDDRARSITPG